MIVVRSLNEETVSIPARLIEQLDLHEGDEIRAVVDGGSLRVTPLARFLRLRGSLANDESFDRAIESLDEAWKAWKHRTSA